MRGVHTFWTFKPGELFIILHTTTREEFYCVLKRLKSSMKRARRLAQLLGGGGLLDAKQLSGLNYYLGGKGREGSLENSTVILLFGWVARSR